jgi:hypothetical protein
MPIRVQLSRRKGWRMPPNTVSVARPTRWGNPHYDDRRWPRTRLVAWFEMMMHGWSPSAVADLPDTQARWVYEYCEEFRRKIGGNLMEAAQSELRGKNLACWCALDKPCHADVLLRIANVEPNDRRGD